MNRLLDHGLDLHALDSRFSNDETGASAYPPAHLLKVILFAYSRCIVGSRGIEAACRENVVFMALSGDNAPHFTIVAGWELKTKGDATRMALTYPCSGHRELQRALGRAMQPGRLG